jgi:exonuclease SbcD
VRLLHFADLHLDTPFRWAPPDVARDWRMSLRQTLLRICQLADEQRVDAITCGGDLYEQDRFTPDTAEFLRATFADLQPLPVYVSPGNHDWFGPGSLYRQVRWSPNVHVFETDRLQPVPLADGLTLWGAAHCAPANTAGFLDGFRVNTSETHLGLFHGSAVGRLPTQESSKVAHAPFAEAQIPDAGLCHVLAGHFHTPYHSANLTYPGNPDPLSFGESGERAAVVADVSGNGTTTITRHPVETFTVHDIDIDVSGATHGGQVTDRVTDALTGLTGVVRVTISGEVAPDVDLRLGDLASLRLPGIEALVARLGKVHASYNFKALSSEPTVRGQFVTDVLADRSLDDDERRRILVTGLRALEGRTDELEVR